MCVVGKDQKTLFFNPYAMSVIAVQCEHFVFFVYTVIFCVKREKELVVMRVLCGLYAWIILVLASALYTGGMVYTRSACIVIHGTWAQGAAWYQPGGDFFEAIARSARELNIVDEVVPFSWSGKLGYRSHVQAALLLLKKIMEYDFVILVAHSHGATVGILASKLLAEKISVGNYLPKISRFYALGVPVDPTGVIYPDMLVIENFYNLFSLGDLVQPVQGMYERCFREHERIANIAIMLDDIYPLHTQLHHATIGKYLLKIPDFYMQNDCNNFKIFQHMMPAEIIFYHHQNPTYALQPNRDFLLQLDKAASSLMDNAFLRKGKQQQEDFS